MLRTDFENHLYTAEVLQIGRMTTALAGALEPLLISKWSGVEVPHGDGTPIFLHHGFVSSRTAFHRTMRSRTNEDGTVEQIPRTKSIRGHDHFLYDVLLAQHRDHVVVAVPFHRLAEGFFVRVDQRLAGTRTLYERLDITKIIIHLAAEQRQDADRQIGITRCQLAYNDPLEHRRDLQSMRLTGANLTATEIYRQVITPVLDQYKSDKSKSDQSESDLEVTPVVLGFASIVGGVKKSSAITDAHGNFKLHVGPGLRQLLRVFDLFDDIEAMKGVASATSNIPILQAGAIEDEA